MARYWVADLHFGHEKVAKLRGFESVEEHDQEIYGQLSELKSHDELWVLGDIVGRSEHDDYALDLLSNVDAEMHLIAGNHDSVSSIHRNGYKHQREWMGVFDSIQQFARMKINKKLVFLSHYPYARSGDGDNREGVRYLEYRLPDMGYPLVHGHTHQYEPHMEAGNLAGGYYQDTQQICVSWDVHRRLVTEYDLNTWIGQL